MADADKKTTDTVKADDKKAEGERKVGEKEKESGGMCGYVL